MTKNIKKTVGFLLIVVFCIIVATWIPQMAKAASEITIDETNFPDKTFREYVADNFDTDNSGKLSETEREDVKDINVYSENIGSLKGMEYFTALASLYCSDNQLTSLDLSHNTALAFLYCSDNQLTSLDLSHNTALVYLNCSNNQLTSLDLSRNVALTSLDCYGNQLTSLDVNRATALASLCCSDNQLTSLDLNGATALTSLDCANNRLTSLDLNGVTALKSLNCFSNQLTNLDLSRNVALTSLDCANNRLTELKLNSQTYSTLLLYKDFLHGDNTSLADLQNVTVTEIGNSRMFLIEVTDITKPATYKVNRKEFTIIYVDIIILSSPKPSIIPSVIPTGLPTQSPTLSPSTTPTKVPSESPTLSPSTMPTASSSSSPVVPSDSHIFSDYSCSNPVTDNGIVIYGNGMTKKIDGKKVNNRVATVYTDILASYKYTENNGVVKPSVGKVIVAVTKSAAKPEVNNKNKITDTSASKMAKAKIKNGQITVTAVGKEGGSAYLWVIDTGSKGVSTCYPINVKLVPKKLEIQNVSGSNLAKNTEVKKGSTLDVCVTGSVGSTKAEDGTYTATVDSKYSSYVTVTPIAGSTNKFTITAKDLKNDKNTKVSITFICDQNNKKTKLPLVITK